MDPNAGPSNVPGIYLTPIEFAQQLNQHQQEILQKDQIIKSLCGDVSSHVNAYTQLQIHTESLLHQVREGNTERVQMQEVIGGLQEKIEDLKNENNQIRMEYGELQDECDMVKIREEEVREAYARLKNESQELRVQLARTRYRLQAKERALNRVMSRDRRVEEEEEEEETGNANAPSEEDSVHP